MGRVKKKLSSAFTRRGKGIVGEEKLGGVPPEKVIEMPMSLCTSDANDSGSLLGTSWDCGRDFCACSGWWDTEDTEGDEAFLVLGGFVFVVPPAACLPSTASIISLSVMVVFVLVVDDEPFFVLFALPPFSVLGGDGETGGMDDDDDCAAAAAACFRGLLVPVRL